MTPPGRKDIGIHIRADMKTRFNHFVDWLNQYHPEQRWTQHTAMDAILIDSWLWHTYLKEGGAL